MYDISVIKNKYRLAGVRVQDVSDKTFIAYLENKAKIISTYTGNKVEIECDSLKVDRELKYIKIYKGNKSGIIDSNCKTIVSTVYNRCDILDYQLALAKSNNGYIAVDLSNMNIIDLYFPFVYNVFKKSYGYIFVTECNDSTKQCLKYTYGEKEPKIIASGFEISNSLCQMFGDYLLLKGQLDDFGSVVDNLWLDTKNEKTVEMVANFDFKGKLVTVNDKNEVVHLKMECNMRSIFL